MTIEEDLVRFRELELLALRCGIVHSITPFEQVAQVPLWLIRLQNVVLEDLLKQRGLVRVAKTPY